MTISSPAVENAGVSTVQQIRLADETDKRVALATVKIGDLQISGLTVWRGGNGHLRVFWPRYWNGANQSDTIELSPEKRADVEADVITAYKAAKAAAQSNAKGAANHE